MSFRVIIPSGREVRVESSKLYDLYSKHTMTIEPLTPASIVHDLYLSDHDTPVMIVAREGVFMSKHLWVQCSMVSTGGVFTHIFNMSDKPVLVRKSECVSHLVGLP